MFLLPGVYITVAMTGPYEFLEGEIIKFDRIITNMGDGYVQSSGKFISTVSGTYQFSGTFYEKRDLIGALLKKNGQGVIQANNGERGTGTLSVILSLKAGDEVYLERPGWVDDDARYSHVSSFSGALLRPDV